MGSQWSLWSRASSYIPVFNMLWAILCWASLSHWIATVLEAETWCSFFPTLKKLKAINCTCLPVFRAAKASLRGFYFSLRSLPNPAFLLGHVLQKWLWSLGACSCKILQWEPFNLRLWADVFFFFFCTFIFLDLVRGQAPSAVRGRFKPIVVCKSKEACHRALCIISAANLPPFCFYPHRCKKCMQSKQFLFSSLPFIVYFFLSPMNELSGLWLSNSPEAGLVTCPVSTCQLFVVHSVLLFFFKLSPTSPIKFPSISSDSPPFYLHFCIQEFYYRVRAFVSLVCMVFHAGRVPAWHVEMERFFFSFFFPSNTEALERNGIVCERVCVKHFQILWGILVLIKHHFFG